MNILNTLKLNTWVIANDSYLRSAERGTLEQVAAKAEKQLGFKVNANNVSKIMSANGICTRRMSAEESERISLKRIIEEQDFEIKQLRKIVAQVKASSLLPDNLRRMIVADLPQQMQEIIDAI